MKRTTPPPLYVLEIHPHGVLLYGSEPTPPIQKVIRAELGRVILDAPDIAKAAKACAAFVSSHKQHEAWRGVLGIETTAPSTLTIPPVRLSKTDLPLISFCRASERGVGLIIDAVDALLTGEETIRGAATRITAGPDLNYAGRELAIFLTVMLGMPQVGRGGARHLGRYKHVDPLRATWKKKRREVLDQYRAQLGVVTPKRRKRR